MKRTAIAAAWILGTTVPLVLCTVFIVGCCVLPFHQVAHKLMPICHVAADLLRGDSGDHHESQAAAPARDKDAPVKRLVTEIPSAFRLAASQTAHAVIAPTASIAYRSFITLGAVRCDRDVGLYVFVATFLI